MPSSQATIHRGCAMALNAADRALAYAEAKRPRFVSELKEFVRFPSVSAQPGHMRDVEACAHWLGNHLRNIGLRTVEVISTAGHPIIYADSIAFAHLPTVLIYGHYDVQPVDPLTEWAMPPFEPTIHGNDLFGRGASDDKGQMFAHVKALESYLQTAG
jgi:acetylornithine deacetylase/succinyl-diaminopimelate desuccinylase-like protein